MLEFLVVGIGGFVGSCARFALTKLLTAAGYIAFPFATLLSNVIAGLLIGFIIGLEQQSISISPRAKLFLTTGLLGGMSTFSTFSLETINFFQDGKYLHASANILLNLALSLIGVVVGMYVAKKLVGKNG
jgi:CrcB protein